VTRSEHLFTEEVRLGLGAGDFDVLDDFLVERNRAERVWARSYTFAGAEDPLAAINRRRAFLEARWRELIQAVREVYSGRLTLAANFDNYHEVAFWDALDFIGINAYFPLRLTLDTPLDLEGLKASWSEIFRDIDTFRDTHDLSQPVVFTELGYTRWRGVTVAPWSSQGFIPLWDPDGETAKDRAFFWQSQPQDPAERALAVAALYELWAEGGADLAGILYWKLSSRIELERYEPFLLHLGERPGDPLLNAFTRFADGIRPLGPRTVREDPYRRAVHAIVRDDLDDLNQLAALGALVAASPPEGHPPLLHLATRLGRGQIVRHLLAAGAALDQRDAGGRLPIHWVCYQGDAQLVDLLRPAVQGPWRDARGETPLMPCARLDNQEVARRLLERGASIDTRNDLGQTVLHLAADQASRTMVELLVAHGGDVNALDERGTTPLHVGARRGELDIVQALARQGKGRPDRKGNLPVTEAVFHGKSEVFEFLFEPDRVREVNAEGQNLLHLAAFGGHPGILQTLLPYFPKVDLPDANGWTPLFYAVADGQAGVVARLLERGASLKHRANDGATALHHGGACGEPRVMKELLRREVDVNMADGEGNTALHHAAGWGRLENMRQLLAKGADPTLRNRDGKTALQLAEAAGRRRAAELLRAALEPSPVEDPG
jgi:ankyrin repeat protein